MSSHATVRPLATSNENRARSLARTTPTDEHDFCGGGAERPKRCEAGLPSSSHLSVFTELLECEDEEEGEERRRGAEAAVAEVPNATIVATTTTERERAASRLLLLLMTAAFSLFLCERRESTGLEAETCGLSGSSRAKHGEGESTKKETEKEEMSLSSTLKKAQRVRERKKEKIKKEKL